METPFDAYFHALDHGFAEMTQLFSFRKEQMNANIFEFWKPFHELIFPSSVKEEKKQEEK